MQIKDTRRESNLHCLMKQKENSLWIIPWN